MESKGVSIMNRKRLWIMAVLGCPPLILLVFWCSGHVPGQSDGGTPVSLAQQTEEQACAKSGGCLVCHAGIEPMHESKNVRLGCIDCHGGDPAAATKEQAHVHPWFPERWPGSR